AGMERQSPLIGRQLPRVNMFLQELRVQKGSGNVSIKSFSALTATEVLWGVLGHTAKAWKRACDLAESYGSQASPSLLFRKCHLPDLPKARELQLLIYDEWALARLAVRALVQAGGNAACPTTINVQSANVQIQKVVPAEEPAERTEL